MRDGAVLVTGSSRGIGREIALRLAPDFALVVVHYTTDRDSAEQVVAAIRAGGAQSVALQADLTDKDGPAKLIEATSVELDRAQLPSLRALVNNAGVNLLATIEEVDAEQIDQIMALNVRAPLLLVKAALPHLHPGSRLIFIGSGSTRFAATRSVAYSGSKGAIDVISRTLAAYLGPRGITVNVVAPGVVDTDMNAAWLRAADDVGNSARQWVSDMAALGRVGDVRDIADIVRFVASGASGWMTGGWLDATGGARL